MLGFEIELDGILELVVGVPATIDVELSAQDEASVAASAFRRVVLWLDFSPLLSFTVKHPEIIESLSLEIGAAMASKHVDFAIFTEH